MLVKILSGGAVLLLLVAFVNGGNTANSTAETEACYNVEDKGELYDGVVNVTTSNKSCQAWALDTDNYCRNPKGRDAQPWCYTTDPETIWDYCSVAKCYDGFGNDDTGNFSLVAVFAIVTLVVCVLSLIILLFLLIVILSHKSKCKRLTMANKYKNSTTETQDAFKESSFELTEANHMNPSYIRRVHEDINIAEFTEGMDLNLPRFRHKDIEYTSDLGKGNFGIVIKAKAKNIIAGEESTIVAIKALKEGSNDRTKKAFFHEAAIMHEFNHQNILKILGVCVEQEPFYMLLEYMENGDLNGYLRKHNVIEQQSSLSLQFLLDMCINIAAGLEYLAQQHYVHCDLATRNCLVDSNFTVKIADFGLSQDVYTSNYYRLRESALLPIRWMPPEAIIYTNFSLQSDVWSFGVVLWEIFSYGAQPYFVLSNAEVADYVQSGEVLKCPAGTPTEIYDLMVKCWATNPDDRPTATELHDSLRHKHHLISD